jgi:hypothetical protein
MRQRFIWLTVALLALSGPAFLAQEPAAGEAQSSKIWLGRNADFEEYLRTAEVEKKSEPSTGVLRIQQAFFKPGGLAAGAAVRNIPPGKRDGYFESYKSEIAAYKLDRMLDLNMVPPTVERRHDGKDAAFQLWVENVKMLSEVTKQGLKDPNPHRWNQNYHRAMVFDYLTGNIDNNSGNWLFDRVWNVYKIDCSRCFTGTPQMKFDARTIGHIDRPFLERLKALDKNAVRKEIGDYLTENNALGGVFARRDALVRDFENMAKKNPQVLEPWAGQGQ